MTEAAGGTAVLLPQGAVLRTATASEWPVVERLWQLFRHDLAEFVDGWPYEDGRYRADVLDGGPRPDLAASIAWRPHPRTGGPAPVGLAVVGVRADGARSMDGFWVAPRLRGCGVGRAIAIAVLRGSPGTWSIGFQDANAVAGAFWRSVAETVFGSVGWQEVRVPVPARASAADDHVIRGSIASRLPAGGAALADDAPGS